MKALEGRTGSRAWSILLRSLGEMETDRREEASPAGLGDSRMSLASVLVPMCLWAWMTLPVTYQVWDCWLPGWDGLEKRTRWPGERFTVVSVLEMVGTSLP